MIDLNTVTVADFKAQFFRNFFYLPVYDPTKIYNSGDETYYNGLFYNAQIDGLTGVPPLPPTDPILWAKVADDIENFVQDADITNAFAEAQTIFNTGLFGVDAQGKLAYLYLTAHYLSNDLKAAMQGINASGAFPVSDRKVGSVSESYEVPKAYTDDPSLALYTSSAYGMKYLSMVLPKLRGNVVGVYGHAHA